MINIKKYLFVCLVLACLVPAIQKKFPFINSAGLKGWFKAAEIPAFNWTTWFSGEFQPNFEKGLESNIGLHAAFVRVNNQINYSFFNFASAKNVLVGKEGYLFEEGYIKGYLGDDFPDSNIVKLKIAKAEYVQQELEKRGKHLIILFAPGKASFYPEYIPDQFSIENKKITWYDMYMKQLKNSSLNYIDFNGYFKKLKGKTPYPLYPKQGTHWSVYGATIAMDSIINYLKYNYKIKIPTFKVGGTDLTEDLRETDYDIGAGMNIMFPMPHGKMAYPKITFDPDSTLFRPATLAVGDSYYWTLMGLGLHEKVFKQNEFWFYNRIEERQALESEIANAIDKKDIIIIIQTEVYYNNVGMGFIESAYNYLKQKNNGL